MLGAYALAAHRDALLVVPTAADVTHYERELAAPGRHARAGADLPGAARRSRTAGPPPARAGDAAAARPRAAPGDRRRCGWRRSRRPAAGVGFAHAARRLIVELEQQRVDPARFAQALRAGHRRRPGGSAYARELAAIYRRYRDELEKLERVDSETFAWGALDALRESPESWGTTPVFLYGFDDLTPIELDTVETLARQVGAAVTVSLTYEPDRPALAARATVVEELRALAESVTQLPALDEYYAADSRAPLHHLERHLFEPDPPLIDPLAYGDADGGRQRAHRGGTGRGGGAGGAARRGRPRAIWSSSAGRSRARPISSSARSPASVSAAAARAWCRSGIRRSAARCSDWCATRCCPSRSATRGSARLPAPSGGRRQLADASTASSARYASQAGRVGAALRASGTALAPRSPRSSGCAWRPRAARPGREHARLIAAPHRGQAPLLGTPPSSSTRAPRRWCSRRSRNWPDRARRLGGGANWSSCSRGLQVPVHGAAAPRRC